MGNIQIKETFFVALIGVNCNRCYETIKLYDLLTLRDRGGRCKVLNFRERG